MGEEECEEVRAIVTKKENDQQDDTSGSSKKKTKELKKVLVNKVPLANDVGIGKSDFPTLLVSGKTDDLPRTRIFAEQNVNGSTLMGRSLWTHGGLYESFVRSLGSSWRGRAGERVRMQVQFEERV